MTGFGDPESLYGVVVSQPVPIWGWGRLPDQYGRDRRDSDEQPDASLSTQQKRAIRKETTAFVMDFGHMDPERLDFNICMAILRTSAISSLLPDNSLEQYDAISKLSS